MIENWRVAHGVVINTFRQTLNRHAKNSKAVVAQRLKRKSTIYYKLLREPGMQLARMHDIAGARLIFDSLSELYEFREKMHNSRFKHELVNSKDNYDYIKHPKLTGYRGIHDVYRYRSFSGSSEHSAWDGLQIEIQYRTKVQHSWATTVEIFDQLYERRLKFGEDGDEVAEFFRHASKVLQAGMEPRDDDDANVAFSAVGTALRLRAEQNIAQRLMALVPLNRPFPQLANSGFSIISLSKTQVTSVLNLGKVSFYNAAKRYLEKEKEFPDQNVVMVRGESTQDTILSFQNYFLDSNSFLDYFMDASDKIVEIHERSAG